MISEYRGERFKDDLREADHVDQRLARGGSDNRQSRHHLGDAVRTLLSLVLYMKSVHQLLRLAWTLSVLVL